MSDALRQTVNRNYHPAVDTLLGAEALEFRVTHPQWWRLALHLAHKHHVIPLLKGLVEIRWRTKPGGQDAAAAIVDSHLEEAGPPAAAATHADHLSCHHHIRTWLDGRDGGALRPILVLARQVMKQIGHRAEAGGSQAVPGDRSNPLELRDGHGGVRTEITHRRVGSTAWRLDLLVARVLALQQPLAHGIKGALQAPPALITRQLMQANKRPPDTPQEVATSGRKSRLVNGGQASFYLFTQYTVLLG